MTPFKRNVSSPFFNALVRFGLLFLSLCVSIVLMETILRVFYPQQLTFRRENKYTVSQCLENWKGVVRSNEYNTKLEFNNRGLRGELVPYQRQMPSLRVFFSGDSFVEAAQVELNNHFGRLTKEILTQKNNKKTETVTCGVGGWDNVQQLIYLKNEAYKYSPDYFLLFVYPGNDINGNYGRYYKENLKQYINRRNLNLLYRSTQKENLFLRLKEYLLSHSHIFTLFKISLEKTKTKSSFEKIQRALKMINIPEKSSKNVTMDTQTTIEKSWELFEFLMKDFSLFCEEQNINFAVAVIPHINQIYFDRYPEQYKKIARNRWGSPDGYSKTIGILKQNNIKVIDLYPGLLKNKEHNVYFHGDRHWTPEGHRVVAGIIAEYLISDM